MNTKPAKKKQSKPIYFRVKRMADPDTGEMIGCLVPRFPCDARTMRERKYRVGDEVRAELKKPRNAGFHRLAHVIGGLMIDQIEDFADLTQHEAFKRLQRESGVCCEQVEIDLGPMGKVLVNQAKSIAFDEMDEGEFNGLVQAVLETIRKRYWPSLSERAIEDLLHMQEREAA